MDVGARRQSDVRYGLLTKVLRVKLSRTSGLNVILSELVMTIKTAYNFVL